MQTVYSVSRKTIQGAGENIRIPYNHSKEEAKEVQKGKKPTLFWANQAHVK